jgi:parvulin-like peptidyl-prolyl isomerase
VKRLITIVLALAFVLAACGGSGETAATVNGSEISSADIEAMLGEALDPTPDNEAQALTTLIQWEATEQAAAEQFDFRPTDDEIDAQVVQVVAQAGADSLEQIAETQRISVDLLRRYIVQLMTRDAIAAELEAGLEAPTDDAIAAELANNPADWTSVCMAHILVATEDEAMAAIERITAGEDFATVATEVSTDTASAISGGDLGCTTAGSFVDEFAAAAMDAPIGAVVGPVETQFGFHVLVVSSREEATPEDVRTTLTDQAVVAASDGWLLEVLRAASVIVSDGFGTWSTDPVPQVTAPTDTP